MTRIMVAETGPKGNGEAPEGGICLGPLSALS